MVEPRARIVIGAVDATAAAFRSVQGNLKGLAAQSQALAGRFGGLTAAIGGALGAAGIGAWLASTVKILDALNDVADATGSAIAKLGGLEDAAARTGTQFEVVATALTKLNQGLNAAAPGSEIERVLEALGLSAQTLREMDPADALVVLARALSQFADDGDKARAVQVLFGRSIRDTAPLLKDLAERGIEAADGLEAQAKAAEALNHSLAGLRKDTTDASRALVSALLPALAQTVSLLREHEVPRRFGQALSVAVQGAAVVGANAAFMFGAIGREIGAIAAQAVALARLDMRAFRAISAAVTEDAQRARAELDAFQARVLAPTAQPATPAPTPQPALPRLRLPAPPAALARGAGRGAARSEVAPIAEDLRAAMQALEATDAARLQALQATLGRLLTLDAGADARVAEAIADVRGEIERLSPAYAAATAAAQAWERSQERLAELTGRAAAQQQAADLALVDEAFFSGAISAAEYDNALARVYRGLEQVADAARPAAEQIGDFARQAQSNIQDALGDTLVQAMQGNFDNIGRSFAALIARMISEAAAADIMSQLFGRGEGGNMAGLANAVIGLFAGGRARGGPVSRGRLYEVNEGGIAETFAAGGRQYLLPLMAGAVQPPAAQAAGGGRGRGGASVVQHISVQGQMTARTGAQLARESARAQARALSRFGG